MKREKGIGRSHAATVAAVTGGSIALAFFGLQPAHAQNHNYSNTNGAFSTGFTPAIDSGSNISYLTFGGDSYTATDDLSYAVTLNALIFENTGAVTVARGGAGTSNLLFLGGMAPSINVTNRGALNIALDITSGENILIRGQGNTAATTFTGDISGSGELDILAGSAPIVLANSGNSYTGGTRFESGVVQITSDGNLGAAPSTAASNLYFSGGTLQLGSGGLVLNANRNVFIYTGQTATIDTQNFVGAVGGVISGDGGLTVTGNGGGLVLAGNNTYTGTTTIGANAAIEVGNGGGVGNNGTTGSLGTGNVVDNGTLAFARGDGITVANAISGTGSVVLDSGYTRLVGSNSYTGGTSVSGGTLVIDSDSNLGAVPSTATTNLTMGEGTTLELENDGITLNANRNISISGGVGIDIDYNHSATINGVISGNGGLNISSAQKGALTLAASNTYSGGTVVDDAVLNLTAVSADGSGYMRVQDGAVLNLYVSGALGGSGPVILKGGTINNYAGGVVPVTHAIVGGTGAGTVYNGGMLTIEDGTSFLDFGAGNSGVAFNFSSAGAFTGTLEIFDWNDAPGADGGLDSLFIGNGATGLTSAQLGDIEFINPDGMTGAYAAQQGSDGSLFANSTAIGAASAPEPGSVALLGLGGLPLALGFVRRRRSTGYFSAH